jgi:nitroreductase
LRKTLKTLGKRTLDDYYRDYYESVQEALEQYDRTGRDRLFHGATAAIVVGARPGASCPAEDALLATQNILLAAHAMGLGTCLIGFAVEAMRAERSIARKLGIPDEESVHAVIALGYPDEAYQKVCGRKKPLVRYAP